MKKLIITLILVLCSMIFFGQSKSGKLIILHTNDIHSNLTGFSPESEYTPCVINNDLTLAGFARMATIIKNEKEKNNDNLLVVDAGDFLMGSFFHTQELETGFQLNIMKEMGYDILSIGNHEFDYGSETIAKIINKSLTNGDIPNLTLSNIKFDSKSEQDDLFEDLYKNNIIKPYHIFEKSGLRIGVFGILGKDAEESAPKIKPLKITDRIKQAKKLVKILKEQEKVDLIICLSHSGLTYDNKKGKWLGEDAELAEKVKGINLIISAHTHTELYEPIWVNDIPIVQAGSLGKNIGRFEINIQKSKILSAKYQLLKIDDNISGNCDIDEKIKTQIAVIDNKLLNPLGLTYNKILAETSYELICDEYGDVQFSNLGPMLADAIHYYVNNYSGVKTDMSIIATGVIRDRIRVGNTGMQTVPDIFKLVSLGEGSDSIPGYPLSQVYLTGKELKSVLELLILASKKQPAYYCFFGGVEIFYNSEKGFMKKIQRIEIGGEEIDFSKNNKKLYAITANSYMLEFIGAINKMSYGLIKVKPKDINANIITDFKTSWIDFNSEKEGIQEGKEWIAVTKYISSFEDTNGNGIPDFPEKYLKPIIRVIDIKKD